MTTTYIALGSNLLDPARQLRQAVTALSGLATSSLVSVSHAYRSAAVGPGQQDDYLNAVACLRTRLAPEELLAALQGLESRQGRTRGVRWGPRTLDLDILLYGEVLLDSPQLTIPHPRMRERNFVLYPLQEICGTNFVLPDGTELGTLVRECPDVGLTRTELQLYDRGPD